MEDNPYIKTLNDDEYDKDFVLIIIQSVDGKSSGNPGV